MTDAAKAFTPDDIEDFWETHAMDNPGCESCRWLAAITDLGAPGGALSAQPHLDAAWGRAESALPSGWLIWSLARETVNGRRPSDVYWRAVAGKEIDAYVDPLVVAGVGLSPVAALDALAAALASPYLEAGS